MEDATELNLTENVMHEAMHPADRYEAFKALMDEGKWGYNKSSPKSYAKSERNEKLRDPP